MSSPSSLPHRKDESGFPPDHHFRHHTRPIYTLPLYYANPNTAMTVSPEFSSTIDTDFVLRLPDDTTFRVLRSVLGGASLVFRAALGADESVSKKDRATGRPVMDLPGETRGEMELFLKYITPEKQRPSELTIEQIFM